MSLDNIYDKTDNARDNLVNAIRTMGVSVAEDSTINQCANAILMIPSGGGGETKFYKCASVDASTQTWTGYELILENGKYTVSTTLTTGLSYTSITPVAGTVYSEDALVKVASYADGIPIDGLVFYAPLSAASSTAETGQALTTDGDVSFTTIAGRDCADFSSGYGLVKSTAYDAALAIGSEGTLSIAFYTSHTHTMQLLSIGASGSSTVRKQANLFLRDGTLSLGNNGAEIKTGSYSTNVWHLLTGTYKDNVANIYLDGVLVGSGNIAVNCDQQMIYIGSDSSFEEPFSGCLAGCRIYNRVLTQEEITALASEFTPTE